MGFVDIHTHFLPEIDDGAGDFDTSLCMLSIAETNNSSKLIATPHFIQGSYENTRELILDKYTKFISNLNLLDTNINIDLHKGCEAFISPELPELVKNKTVASLNDTSYILVELPMMGLPIYMDEVFYSLQLYGYKPVIAHPERNSSLSVSIDLLHNLVQHGMFVQINSGSLLGIHGKAISKISHEFIKRGLVHFVASDAHSCRGRSPVLSSAFNLIKESYGEELANRLFELNGEALLADDEVQNAIPCKVKRKFFIFGG